MVQNSTMNNAERMVLLRLFLCVLIVVMVDLNLNSVSKVVCGTLCTTTA